MRNFMLELSYDGSRYHGWQRQGNTGVTIQGKLEDTLSRILEQPIELHGAGRTDAGVHALGQVASFHAETLLPCSEILAQLRAFLPEDIGANTLTEASPRFHARLSCTGKTYRYRIWNSTRPCVFRRKYVWKVPEPLNDTAMRQAASLLCGTHDFSAFRTGRSKKSAVRRLDRIEIFRSGEELCIDYTGSAFLYNMARILTGTLVAVGSGRMAAEDVESVLASRDRASAGPTAPAQGLCLTKVYYPESTAPHSEET